MISLIICSRKSDISFELKNNIQQTIGTEYELIVVNNSEKQYNIFQAYNIGVQRSQSPILCFMHEDILFHTTDWGKKVVKHFENPQLGLIGVVGAHVVPKAPFGWNTFHHTISCNIIQRITKGRDSIKEHWSNLRYMDIDNSAEAIVADGVWFCISQKIMNRIRFDDTTFCGFHCYDMDICLQIKLKNFQVRIVADILLEHFSQGNYGRDWLIETQKLYNKWKEYLPLVAGNISLQDDEIQELSALAMDIFELKKEIVRIRQSKAFQIGKHIINLLTFWK